ncbi:MAG: nitroreductase family protein [Defluviitaleaceae bacterium]|nr:nitroreductase family protein [Defluviitaleaceae bacterium]
MIIDSIKNRRSIRKFKPVEISKEQIKTMLEAAMLAPSACNTRPWRFIAITSRELLNKLADAHPYAKMLTTASLCIVVVALPKLQEGHESDLPKGFFPQDCGAAALSILLQAEAMGLGSCWCGVYPKEAATKSVTEVLSIPDGEFPFCLIAIGEKDQYPAPRGRYEEEKVTWM